MGENCFFINCFLLRSGVVILAIITCACREWCTIISGRKGLQSSIGCAVPSSRRQVLGVATTGERD